MLVPARKRVEGLLSTIQRPAYNLGEPKKVECFRALFGFVL